MKSRQPCCPVQHSHFPFSSPALFIPPSPRPANRMRGGGLVCSKRPRWDGEDGRGAFLGILLLNSSASRGQRGQPLVFFEMQFMCWSKFRPTISVHFSGR